MVDPARYRQLFVEGAREQLQALGEALTAPGPPDIGALRRAWHTLKGMSATMGFEDLARQAHAAEDALRGEAPLPAAAFALSAHTAGLFEAALLAAESARPVSGPPAAAASIPGLPPSVRVPAADLMSLARDLAGLRAQLPAPALDEVGDGQHASDDASPAVRPLLRRLTRLQESVQRLLLLPAAALVPGLRIALADAARQLGRDVVLEVAGQDLMLERATLELLATPLHHLLRNAVAHGIEPAETRRRSGKPGAGMVRVRFAVHGRKVEVSVDDDGGGVPLDRLHAALGDDSPGVATLATAQLDLAPYLCRPGLTTAPLLTETAGRGVGLDAVRAALHRHGGRLRVTTVPARGTRAVIEAPVGLQVTSCLLARRHGLLYAVPIGSIERIPPRRAGAGPATGATLLLATADGTEMTLPVDEIRGRFDAVFQPVPPGFDAGGTYLGVALTRQGDPVLLLRPGRSIPEPQPAARSL